MKGGVGMAGQLQESGCRLSVGVKGQEDSELFKRFKRAGLVTLGSTNVPELCGSSTTESVLFGPAKNPWNIDYSTGGSSGGAACAVAAGIVPMADASDGGGSIRVPAHCCGVFGLAPSRGRTPCGPHSYGTAFGLQRNHVITRSVRDSAAMLDQLHGPEHGALFRLGDPSRPYLDEVDAKQNTLKIAFSTASPSGLPVDPDCVAAVERAIKLCQKFGHQIEETAPMYDWDQFIRAFGDNWCFIYAGTVENLRRTTGRKVDADTLERSTLLALDHANTLSQQRIRDMFMDLYSINRDVEAFFDDWDILITPVALTPAMRLGEINGNGSEFRSFDLYFDRIVSQFAAFTPICNASGQPSMSVPLHQSHDGLPIGVQCTARVGDEAALIRLAAQFEKSSPWVQRIPQLGVLGSARKEVRR